jgi:hypothetical protein
VSDASPGRAPHIDEALVGPLRRYSRFADDLASEYPPVASDPSARTAELTAAEFFGLAGAATLRSMRAVAALASAGLADTADGHLRAIGERSLLAWWVALDPRRLGRFNAWSAVREWDDAQGEPLRRAFPPGADAVDQYKSAADAARAAHPDVVTPKGPRKGKAKDRWHPSLIQVAEQVEAVLAADPAGGAFGARDWYLQALRPRSKELHLSAVSLRRTPHHGAAAEPFAATSSLLAAMTSAFLGLLAWLQAGRAEERHKVAVRIARHIDSWTDNVPGFYGGLPGRSGDQPSVHLPTGEAAVRAMLNRRP